jgi:hypothetical protein
MIGEEAEPAAAPRDVVLLLTTRIAGPAKEE